MRVSRSSRFRREVRLSTARLVQLVLQSLVRAPLKPLACWTAVDQGEYLEAD